MADGSSAVSSTTTTTTLTTTLTTLMAALGEPWASRRVRLTPLSGGLLNFVWRGELDAEEAEGAGAASVVLKHTPDFVASNSSVPLASVRQDFELRALELLQAGSPLRVRMGVSAVRVPRCLAASPRRSPRVLVLEDVGEGPSLADVLAADSEADLDASTLERVGRELGTFIGALHVQSSLPGVVEAAAFANADVQTVRFAVQYEPAEARWLALVGGVEVGSEVRTRIQRAGARVYALGVRLRDEAGRCLTMGDLWTASVLLRVSPDEARSVTRALHPVLIDWEFAHWGDPLQDVAHLAAHLCLADWCAGRGAAWTGRHEEHAGAETMMARGRSVWTGFWDAYCAAWGAARSAGEFVLARWFGPSADASAWRADACAHCAAEVLVRVGGSFPLPFFETHREEARAAAQWALELADAAGDESGRLGLFVFAGLDSWGRGGADPSVAGSA